MTTRERDSDLRLVHLLIKEGGKIRLRPRLGDQKYMIEAARSRYSLFGAHGFRMRNRDILMYLVGVIQI